jgi:hypothetical protein
MNLNRVRALVGLDYIEDEDIEAAFAEWNEFVQRKDANDHMQHWVLGKPLEDLPPEPEDKEESAPEAASPEGEAAPDEAPLEEGTIFGGDYGDTDHGEEDTGQSGPADEAPSPEDEVPVLRASDDAEGQGEEDNSEVCKVPA